MSAQMKNFSIRTVDTPVGRYHIIDRRKLRLSDYILQNKRGIVADGIQAGNTGKLRGK